MATCEKCWADAHLRAELNPEKLQAEHYHDLIYERWSNPCSAEEQAGENAQWCPTCERKTIHQITKKCVICYK